LSGNGRQMRQLSYNQAAAVAAAQAWWAVPRNCLRVDLETR
jgi:hypothetical protein